MFDSMNAFPMGRYRAYDGGVFFSAWWPENESGIVVAGSWRNAWSTDDEDEAREVVARLNALGRKRWGVTTYGGPDMPRRNDV